MVDPFDDEEIMGDHEIIVGLYRACRSLQKHSQELEEEVKELKRLYVDNDFYNPLPPKV